MANPQRGHISVTRSPGRWVGETLDECPFERNPAHSEPFVLRWVDHLDTVESVDPHPLP